MQHFLGVHGRPALRRGRLAQGTPGDDALGVVSPVAITSARSPSTNGWSSTAPGSSPPASRPASTAPCASRPSCAATRPHRPSNFTWSYAPEPPFDSGTPETAPAAILRTGAAIGAGHHGAAGANGTTRRRQTRHRRSGRGRGMTSLAQGRLARTEGLLARPPTVVLLNWIAPGSVEASAAMTLRQHQ